MFHFTPSPLHHETLLICQAENPQLRRAPHATVGVPGEREHRLTDEWRLDIYCKLHYLLWWLARDVQFVLRSNRTDMLPVVTSLDVGRFLASCPRGAKARVSCVYCVIFALARLRMKGRRHGESALRKVRCVMPLGRHHVLLFFMLLVASAARCRDGRAMFAVFSVCALFGHAGRTPRRVCYVTSGHEATVI